VLVLIEGTISHPFVAGVRRIMLSRCARPPVTAT
jgi:hypothetical protein